MHSVAGKYCLGLQDDHAGLVNLVQAWSERCAADRVYTGYVGVALPRRHVPRVVGQPQCSGKPSAGVVAARVDGFAARAFYIVACAARGETPNISQEK